MNKVFSAYITHDGISTSYTMNTIVARGDQYVINVGNQNVESAWYTVACIGFI